MEKYFGSVLSHLTDIKDMVIDQNEWFEEMFYNPEDEISQTSETFSGSGSESFDPNEEVKPKSKIARSQKSGGKSIQKIIVKKTPPSQKREIKVNIPKHKFSSHLSNLMQETNIIKERRESLNSSSMGTPRKLSKNSSRNQTPSKLSYSNNSSRKMSVFSRESPDNKCNQKKLSTFFANAQKRERTNSPSHSIKNISVASPKENRFSPSQSKHQSK